MFSNLYYIMQIIDKTFFKMGNDLFNINKVLLNKYKIKYIDFILKMINEFNIFSR